MNRLRGHKFRVMNKRDEPCYDLLLEDIEGEIWIDVRGYDGIYEISNMGRVKSIGRYVNSHNGSQKWVKDKILKQNHTKELNVKLSVNNTPKTHNVATLVAEAFLKPKQKGEVVTQVDKDYKNCKLSNLKICSVSESKRLDYSNGKRIDWGIGQQRVNNRLAYELENGVFENGELVSIRCSVCHSLKDTSEFYKRKNTLRRECKRCLINKAIQNKFNRVQSILLGIECKK